MKLFQLFLTSCALALVFLGTASGADESVEGDWIGGFERDEEWIFIRARFIRKDGELQGNCDITGESLFPEMAKPLRRIRSDADRIRFVLPRKNGRLSFDGKIRDRRIEGTVVQNERSTEFQLTRIKAVHASRYQGIYRYQITDRDHVTYIGSGAFYSGFLGILNFTTGRIDGLFPLSATTFFAGPSLLVTRPEKLRIEFTLDDDQRATKYSLLQPGRKPVIADRVRYREEEVTFKSGDVALQGTLVLPDNKGPHPIIVFVPASRQYATREGSRPLAEFFAYHGISGFIYDKRGTGASKGKWLEASFDDLANDTLAAVDLLKRRQDIDAKQIGLFGGSQSGWIVGLAASRSRDVAFIISTSGPGVTPEEQELYRAEHWLRADGFAEADIDKAMAYTRFRYECARTNKGWDRLADMDIDAKKAAWAGYVGAGVGRNHPFWKFFNLIRDYDPAPALEKVKCPVLAIFGERDTFLPVEKSVRVWRDSLQKAGNDDVTIKVFPRGGHGLQEVETGGLKEMTKLTNFVDGYFATMRDWVLEHVEVRDAR